MNHPLRLAVGSHEAGSGKGCAMNVISWESGDSTITDLPACADQMLARIVQYVNDHICAHRDGDLLCPSCSVEVLALGHRIVGTGTHPMSDLDRRRAWVRVAADQARQVVHLADVLAAWAAIEAAEAWADDPTPERKSAAHTAAARADAAYAAYAAYAADAAYAAYVARAYATHAAYAAVAAVAAGSAAAVAADAAAVAADCADAPGDRLRLAHRAVDMWCELAGFTPAPVDPAVTAAAVRAMEVVR